MVASSSAGFFSSIIAEGQAVHEEQDIGPAGVAILGDGELIDGEELVVCPAGFEIYDSSPDRHG